LLAELHGGKVQLPNVDFDTGRATKAGEYKLTDDTYADLLDKIAQHKYDLVTPELRANILDFYRDLNAPFATKRHLDRWKQTLRELDELKALNVTKTTVSPAGAHYQHK
jgi:hypothetical protein